MTAPVHAFEAERAVMAQAWAHEMMASHPRSAPPLRVLWITPMRALAADTTRALGEPLQDMAPHWTLGLRTGDTASAERARQDRRLPTALVTTPESLSLLLTRADARERANVARRHPERLAELKARWEDWNAQLPPIPEDARSYLPYSKQDIP